jgi:hypothetical protein
MRWHVLAASVYASMCCVRGRNLSERVNKRFICRKYRGMCACVCMSLTGYASVCELVVCEDVCESARLHKQMLMRCSEDTFTRMTVCSFLLLCFEQRRREKACDMS